MTTIPSTAVNLEATPSQTSGGPKTDRQLAPRRFFALFGKPVSHSLSPLLHNAAMTNRRYQGYYFACEVENLGAAIQGVRGLGLKGVSITMPFKEEVMAHLDKIDPAAASIGAVNTIVNDGGLLVGHNTDWLGLVNSIEEHFPIPGHQFLILGSGGAARAAIYGILQRGGKALLAARNREKGQAMARQWGIPFVEMDQVNRTEAFALINATPVGMAPRSEESPLPAAVAAQFPFVLDMIYRPLSTRLIRDARAGGAMVIDGLGMFIHQGLAQFKLWTGLSPSQNFIRKVLDKKLSFDEKKQR